MSHICRICLSFWYITDNYLTTIIHFFFQYDCNLLGECLRRLFEYLISLKVISPWADVLYACIGLINIDMHVEKMMTNCTPVAWTWKYKYKLKMMTTTAISFATLQTPYAYLCGLCRNTSLLTYVHKIIRVWNRPTIKILEIMQISEDFEIAKKLYLDYYTCFLLAHRHNDQVLRFLMPIALNFNVQTKYPFFGAAFINSQKYSNRLTYYQNL